jgi:hypothetical protein
MPKTIITRGWRRLQLPDLEMLVVRAQREAIHRHLSVAEWK